MTKVVSWRGVNACFPVWGRPCVLYCVCLYTARLATCQKSMPPTAAFGSDYSRLEWLALECVSCLCSDSLNKLSCTYTLLKNTFSWTSFYLVSLKKCSTEAEYSNVQNFISGPLWKSIRMRRCFYIMNIAPLNHVRERTSRLLCSADKYWGNQLVSNMTAVNQVINEPVPCKMSYIHVTVHTWIENLLY